VKKTGIGTTTKKIQNPEWRTCACLCFFSLTGGLIKFFYDCYFSYWLGELKPPKAITPTKIL
jgi:hypothetical protein